MIFGGTRRNGVRDPVHHLQKLQITFLAATFLLQASEFGNCEKTLQKTKSSLPTEPKTVSGGHHNATYRPVSDDDDEVNDEEILQAVQNSLRQWELARLNKTHRQDHAHNRVKRDEEVVCYGAELGCFRDEGPFDYLDMLPSPPEEIDTKFFVYAKDAEPEVYSFFNHSKISETSVNWNVSRPTKVIIHGFGSTCRRMWATEMRLALLSIVDCNVVCVDWTEGSRLPNYLLAAANTRLVGKQLAVVIRKLVDDNRGFASYEDFHLIGFSLGAHVAGFTGQELRNISRITGLDPAGPLFENYDKRVRLDASDALFVDVIHSNGDSLLMGGLGSWEGIGDVDFYPNGGRVQKGCSNLFLGAFRDFIWSSPTKESTAASGGDTRNGKSLSASENDGRSLCNHRRAYRFFTESVSPLCVFPAYACESYEKFLTGSCFQWDNQLIHSAHMGYYADEHQNNPRVARKLQQQGVINPSLPKASGKKFYLITRDDEPFCANQFKLTLESSPPLGLPISTYGGVEATIISSNEEFNETFLVTQTHKDNMISGSVLQGLVVAHPSLNNPSKVILKYTAYKGWIYSGIMRWSLDRLIVTNSFGISYSFCARGLMLPSGISVTITLTKGICTVINFPFRYPHPLAHPQAQQFMVPHHNHPPNIMHPPPVIKNELNETIFSPQGSSSAPINDQPSHQDPSNSESSLQDWSRNDWQPIIINDTIPSHGQPDPYCIGENCPPLPSSPSSPPSPQQDGDQTVNEVTNEIGGPELRRSRQLSPVLLLPLSRGIEPRPVVLRASRKMHLPPDLKENPNLTILPHRRRHLSTMGSSSSSIHILKDMGTSSTSSPS